MVQVSYSMFCSITRCVLPYSMMNHPLKIATGEHKDYIKYLNQHQLLEFYTILHEAYLRGDIYTTLKKVYSIWINLRELRKTENKTQRPGPTYFFQELLVVAFFR